MLNWGAIFLDVMTFQHFGHLEKGTFKYQNGEGRN